MKEAIRREISIFPFWDYGLGEVDPTSDHAEWVDDLAEKIHTTVVEYLDKVGNR